MVDKEIGVFDIVIFINFFDYLFIYLLNVVFVFYFNILFRSKFNYVILYYI